jgi:hypothetical protein
MKIKKEGTFNKEICKVKDIKYSIRNRNLKRSIYLRPDLKDVITSEHEKNWIIM